MGRKRLSDRTKLAATLLARGEVPYDHAKLMTEDQIISLYQFDHNILHETKHPDRDKFWNIAPLLIRTHRAKTKFDLSAIAKSKRLRKANEKFHKNWAKVEALQREETEKIAARVFNALSAGFQEGMENCYDRTRRPSNAYADNYNNIDWNDKPKRKIRSRGFDKRLKRKFDGTVVKR